MCNKQSANASQHVISSVYIIYVFCNLISPYKCNNTRLPKARLLGLDCQFVINCLSSNCLSSLVIVHTKFVVVNCKCVHVSPWITINVASEILNHSSRNLSPSSQIKRPMPLTDALLTGHYHNCITRYTAVPETTCKELCFRPLVPRGILVRLDACLHEDLKAVSDWLTHTRGE